MIIRWAVWLTDSLYMPENMSSRLLKPSNIAVCFDD